MMVTEQQEQKQQQIHNTKSSSSLPTTNNTLLPRSHTTMNHHHSSSQSGIVSSKTHLLEERRALSLLETEIDNELHDLISHRSEQDSLMIGSLAQTNEIDPLFHHIEGLMSMITKTYAASNILSVKVESLESKSSRVTSTLEILETVVKLHGLYKSAHRAFFIGERQVSQSSSLALTRRESFLGKNVIRPNPELMALPELYDRLEQTAFHIQEYLSTPLLNEVKAIYAMGNQSPGDIYVEDVDDDEDGQGKKTTRDLQESNFLMGPCPTTLLDEIKKSLIDSLLETFQHAIQTNDSESMLKCFKIFPLIEEFELGLDQFSAFLSSMISRHSQEQFKQALTNAPQKKTVYADLLTRLFESIASMIDQQLPMVEMHYGPGKMLLVLHRLQRQVDIQSTLVLDSLTEQRQYKRKIDEIQKYEDLKRRREQSGIPATSSSQSQNQNLEPPYEPKEIDFLLTEISSISQKSHLFDRFLRIRANEELQKLDESERKLYLDRVNALSTKPLTSSRSEETRSRTTLPSEDGLTHTSKLNEHIQSLVIYFVGFHDYFLKLSIQKAIAIDQVEPGLTTSSCVDDVFYILRSSMSRAVHTHDAECLCACLNSIGRVLEVDYMSILQKRLSSSFSSTGSSQSSSFGDSNTKDGKGNMSFMVNLNNIDVSCQYMVKLVEEVQSEVRRVYGHVNENILEKIQSCLDFLSEYAAKFKGILNTWLENYVNQTIKPKIKPIVQGITLDLKYVLSEDEYSLLERLETSSVFTSRFANALCKLMAPFYPLRPLSAVTNSSGSSSNLMSTTLPTLTDANAQFLALFVIELLLKDMERWILNGGLKLNLLGALRFDKDIRAILSWLTLSALPTSSSVSSSNSGWSSVRDKFSWLMQVSLLLGCDGSEEILDVIEANGGGVSTTGSTLNVAAGASEVTSGGRHATQWKIKSNDLRKVLSCRVDLSSDVFSELKLQ